MKPSGLKLKESRRKRKSQVDGQKSEMKRKEVCEEGQDRESIVIGVVRMKETMIVATTGTVIATEIITDTETIMIDMAIMTATETQIGAKILTDTEIGINIVTDIETPTGSETAAGIATEETTKEIICGEGPAQSLD